MGGAVWCEFQGKFWVPHFFAAHGLTDDLYTKSNTSTAISIELPELVEWKIYRKALYVGAQKPGFPVVFPCFSLRSTHWYTGYLWKAGLIFLQPSFKLSIIFPSLPQIFTPNSENRNFAKLQLDLSALGSWRKAKSSFSDLGLRPFVTRSCSTAIISWNFLPKFANAQNGGTDRKKKKKRKIPWGIWLGVSLEFYRCWNPTVVDGNLVWWKNHGPPV